MRTAFMLILGLGLMQASAATKDAAIKKDKDDLQGTWSVISVTSDGKVTDVVKLLNAKVIFQGDKVSGKVIRLGKDNETPYRLDPTQKVKAIDFVHSDGAATPAIYDLNENKLKICSNQPKAPRPTTFVSKQGSGNVLIILRRDR